MANSCFLALVLLTIFEISNGQLASCNYVYGSAPPLGIPIAVDICREITVSSSTTWRKYRCNGTKMLDEVYDDTVTNCGGFLQAVNDVTSSIHSFQCGVQGSGSSNCGYVLRKEPCSDSDPSSVTTYNVEPIITDTCIQFVSGQTMSFKWLCNNGAPSQDFRPQYGDCTGAEIPANFPPDLCNTQTGLLAQTVSCGIKVYGPTQAPTYAPSINPSTTPTRYPTGDPTGEPTGEPTTEPTAEPTVEPTTSEPSKAPSNMPSAMPSNMPSGAPTAKVTEAFYMNTTVVDADYVSRIQIIQNLIFVSFIMIFMSFVL